MLGQSLRVCFMSVLCNIGKKALMFLVTLAYPQYSYIKISAQLYGGAPLWNTPTLKLQWIPPYSPPISTSHPIMHQS